MKYLLSIMMSLAVPVAASAATICKDVRCVDAEVVSDSGSMARGLSGRTSLASDKGMLFVFDQEGLHAFWMNNMLFELDIVWLDASGKIVHIAEDLKPCETDRTCNSYVSPAPATYVLEVPAGFCRANGWKQGTVLNIRM